MEHIGMNSKQFDLDVIQIVLENDNIDRRYNTKLVCVQIKDIVTENKVYEAQKGLKEPMFCLITMLSSKGHPGVSGILGEGLFIFKDLECTGNYFRRAGWELIFLEI